MPGGGAPGILVVTTALSRPDGAPVSPLRATLSRVGTRSGAPPAPALSPAARVDRAPRSERCRPGAPVATRTASRCTAAAPPAIRPQTTPGRARATRPSRATAGGRWLRGGVTRHRRHDRAFADALGLSTSPEWGDSTRWQYWVIEVVKQDEQQQGDDQHPGGAPGAPAPPPRHGSARPVAGLASRHHRPTPNPTCHGYFQHTLIDSAANLGPFTPAAGGGHHSGVAHRLPGSEDWALVDIEVEE
jgi:hypothetical protein